MSMACSGALDRSRLEFFVDLDAVGCIGIEEEIRGGSHRVIHGQHVTPRLM